MILSDGEKGAEILENQPKSYKRLKYQQPYSPANTPLCAYPSHWAYTLKPQVFVSVFLIPGTTSLFLIISLQLLAMQPRPRNYSSNPTSFGELHNPDPFISHDTFFKCCLQIDLSPENLHVMLT